MFKFKFRLLIVSLLFLFVNQIASAQCPGVCSPNLYEEFNYPANTSIFNAIGGSGWLGGWDVQNTATTVPGYSTLSGSLSSGTIKAFNNKLSGGISFNTIGRFINTSNSVGSPFVGLIDSANLVGAHGTTLYFAVLIKKKGNNQQNVKVTLHKGNTAWAASTSGSFGFGYFGLSSETSGTKFWSLQLESAITKSSVQIKFDTTALIVLKMEFLTNSTKFSLFVNPATIGSGGEPTTPTLTQTISKVMDFKSMAIRLGDAAAQGEIDELRMSTTYPCATPDASTAYNLLPIANFTSNVTSGTLPFTASFNGALSADPDGTISNYNWSFSDGGTATGVATNYNFNNQGAIVATLTVKDNCGSTNALSTTISVNNPNGYFSCFSTPQLSKFGACDSVSGGGEIIISGGTSYSLKNIKTGNIINQVLGTFSNLNAGYYNLSAVGDFGCKDTFNLQVPISHECAGQARGTLMKMGINVEELDYFSQCASFKDYMKSSQNFFSARTNGSGSFDSGVMNEIPVDVDGYPLQVPVSTSDGLQKVRKIISSKITHMPLDTNYVLLYDGSGSIIMGGGATTKSSSPGIMVVKVTGITNVWIDITSSSITNHVRNIRFMRAADTASYQTEPFDDRFLNILCNFSCIRTMDWTCTNNNTNTTWTNRTLPTFHSQSQLATGKKGVAYEHLCQLANITGKDIWVNVPHLADDNYITEMANLFKTNLNPGIKVFLEFSNEVWNSSFGQSTSVNNAGPQNISTGRRYALRCAHVFTIWKQQWGNDATRVIRVLGTQAASNSTSQNEMAELQSNFDVLSPALYFNYSNDATCYSSLKAVGSAATAHDVLNCAKNDFFNHASSFLQNSKDAWMYGKGVVYYEWGQGMTSGKLEAFQDSNYAAQISVEMGQFYQQVIDSMKRWNTDQINPYALTGNRQSVFGSWGHLEYINQNIITEPAPKFSALLANINPAVQGTCFYPGVPIYASSATNGSINPSGTVLATVNGNQTFAITPNAGFCIQNVLVDGNNVGAVSSFTFTNITATHTISVTYTTAVIPSIIISTAATTICRNSNTIFNAIGTNTGSSPTFQWKKNNILVGTGSSFTFAPNTLSNSDTIKCILTANNVCQTSATANSNIIILTVNQSLSAPVAITTISKTASSINLSWSTIAGAASYQLDVANDSNFTSLLIGYSNLSVAATSQSISGLTPSTIYFVRIRSVSTSGCISINSSTYNDTTPANVATLTITVFIQGLYSGGRTMTPALFNANGSSPINIADSILVELHSNTSPFDLVYSNNGMLGTNGNASFIFPVAAIGNSYYIVIKNRNAMETWSALPVVISSNTFYDFSSTVTH